MRSWNLTSQDLSSLTIAADARLTVPDYLDDQIWELSLKGGDPPALALETTYGLRSRGFRIFPRFVEEDQVLTDPAFFAIPPIVKRFYPNYLSIALSPFDGIDVELDYWVPTSKTVAGRLKFFNQDSSSRQIRLELNALLTPIDEGERMAPLEVQATTVLSGRTGELCPVLFVTGGPLIASGPYPGLAIALDLPPGASRKVAWTHAALPDLQAGFELSRQIATRNWEAERARIEMANAGQVEVLTGDPQWDLAFALSQKIALGLFTGPTDHLPRVSFVNNRLPDQGYSFRGDGSDYGHLWNGQRPLESYYLINLILQSAPQLARDIVDNFLHTETEDGFIDWKPGLGGQRSNRLAIPLLATLVWQIFEVTEDLGYLQRSFPALMKFFLAWLSQERDQDGDGVPEWENVVQSGFEEHPEFSRWHTWAQGVDITTVESPSLCSFLYRESQTLIRMAKIIGKVDSVEQLRTFSENLRIAVEEAWDSQSAQYCYRDRDTHETTAALAIGRINGNGEILAQKNYEWPVRLLFRVAASGESTRRPKIFIHGVSASGSHKVERLSLERFQWYLGWATATSEHTYASLEQVEIQGLHEGDLVMVQSVGLDSLDHTLLIPLWAGLASRENAKDLLLHTITSPDKFWQSYGLPACPKNRFEITDPAGQDVHMIWNTLVGEGMVDYGYRVEAAELLTRLMAAITRSLKEEGHFLRTHNAYSGNGSGERDALMGLAPLGLFLKVLGINLISPYKVRLDGSNPFPWPVTVKYRGLTILRQKEKTTIIFPDGQTTEVSSPEPQIIELA